MIRVYIHVFQEFLWHHCPPLNGRIILLSLQTTPLLWVIMKSFKYNFFFFFFVKCAVLYLRSEVRFSSLTDSKPTRILCYIPAFLRCWAGRFAYRIFCATNHPFRKSDTGRQDRKNCWLLRILILLSKEVIALKCVKHFEFISWNVEVWEKRAISELLD